MESYSKKRSAVVQCIDRLHYIHFCIQFVSCHIAVFFAHGRDPDERIVGEDGVAKAKELLRKYGLDSPSKV